jgi:tol-pal system protein YbgF
MTWIRAWAASTGSCRTRADLYADLDKRLTEAASAASAAGAAAAAAAAASPGVMPTTAGDEKTLYDRAFEQLKNRNYAAAVESYPNGQLADNTQYWLGEAYYVTQEYDHAAAAFQRVVANWPNSRKVPDALLKLGYTQLEQGKLPAGRATLQQVVQKYPDSDAARLATERLAKLPKQ